MVLALDGYTLLGEVCADHDFVLARAVCAADGRAVLVRRARHADLASLAALEREFALRTELDPAWSLAPRALLGEGAGAALVLDQPGAAPLTPLALQAGAPLALDAFLRIGAAIAWSLAQMHRSLIVHQNLTPSHILLQEEGPTALLTGFGMADRIARVQDTRADLYSAGVILHQMLTGALPFAAAGAAWSADDGARCWNGIDPTCKAIVQKLLAGGAEHRYQSAAGLYADLQQCRKLLDAGGAIVPFVLGAQDGVARVRIPERLIGRDTELAQLAAALHEARSAAAPELLLVSGHAGTGKTALLAALHRIAQDAGATVIAGRFDPLQRDIPYATLAQAFQGLVRQRLARGESALAPWRLQLMAALGQNARLMLELIPELKFVIGAHPAPAALAPAEAQVRFETVFRKFVAACSAPDSVLLICLDELQAIDPASLHLLTHLLTHPGVRHVLVVAAHRADALPPAHPVALAREAMRALGTRLREIGLQTLDRHQSCQLVAEALGCEPEPVSPLSTLIYPKTGGNPHFLLQFLTRIGEDGLLHFSLARQRWDWDTAAIQAREYAENVIDLMVARVQQIPPATREQLTLLACLGGQADLETIALVSGMSLQETDECLWPATRMGLVLREPQAYRFVHERVRACAYALIAGANLPERHLHIGRLLLAATAAEAMDKQLFSIVHHLNLALPAITDSTELARLGSLNARAGAKARDAIAYDSARDYFSLAAGLCRASAWQDDFDATFALYAALAECEYLCGHLERAGRLFALLTEQARTRVDIARVTLMRIALYQVTGRFEQAACAALDTLALFGVHFPEQPDQIAAALAAERVETGQNMGARQVAGLAAEPASDDPEVAIVGELLADMGSCIFSARPQLYPLLAAKALNFTLRYGSTDTSAITYSRYAILLVSLGAMPEAFDYSDLALRMVQRQAGGNERAARRSGRLRFVHGAYIHSWRQPIATSVAELDLAFQVCQEAGDLPHAGYAAHVATWNRFEAGLPLHQVVQAAHSYQAFARQQRNEPLLQLLRCYEQLARCLQGLTGPDCGIDDAHFRAADALAVFTQASFGAAQARFHLMRQIAAFSFGHHHEALQAGEAASQLQHFFLASVNDATHHFYHALSMAALFHEAPLKRQSATLAALRDKQEKLRAWAAGCPGNFENRYLLVTAELARVRGDQADAMTAYDGAIASAGAAGFVQNQALACELAARFCRSVHQDPGPYAQRALAGWRKWGADGKVRQLLLQFPELASSH